jgi:hypothetical protein
MSEVVQNKNFQTPRKFLGLKWVKRCFDAFAHTSRPPESWPEKKYFVRSEVV